MGRMANGRMIFNDVFAAVHTIECDYRCFYKCYFRGNCYGLSRMHHRRSCVRLPCAPSTKFGLCGVSAFKADWSHCGYRSLKTCEKEQIVGGLFPYQFYVDQINRQVECLYQKWDAHIKQWKLCSEQQLYSVKAKWEACMVSRKGKVTIFTRCPYGKRDHTRACLEQRLKERARCHLIQFDKFFFSAFGTNPHDLIKSLRTHYCACVM